MPYDFTTPVDRTGTCSLKWMVEPGELPVWVADMDFETAPAISEALQKRVSHHIFGYTRPNPAWYAAYQHWWADRYGWRIEKETMLFATGIMPALHSAVRRFTQPGEKVVIMTPVYHCFFESVEENGRVVSECPLAFDGSHYSLDMRVLEEKLRDPLASAMILCNPHNPTGQIWTKDELAEIGRLAKAYGVTVLCDEIHCDLVDPGFVYTPFASVDDTCAEVSVIFISPSKTFNVPGLHTSAVVIADPQKRGRMARALHADQIGSPGALTVEATIAAYEEGEAWVEELRRVLLANKNRVADFCEEHIPGIRVTKMPATYLVWLNCSELTDDTAALVKHLRKTEGLIISAGGDFRGNGAPFLRFNAATQPCRIEDALLRLKRGVESWRRGVRA